jgi:glycerol-1-phosphate dehydrogenase [NAD(P)+]
MAKFYERFFARNPFDIDMSAIQVRKQRLEDIETSVQYYLGRAAEGVIQVARSTYMSWEEQQRHIETLQSSWKDIESLRKLVPTFDRIVKIQQDAGASIMPEDVDVDRELLREALLNAKDVRSRYTVLRAAEMLGWLEEITDEVVSDYAPEG